MPTLWWVVILVALLTLWGVLTSLRHQDARALRDAKLALVRDDCAALIGGALAALMGVKDMCDYATGLADTFQDAHLEEQLRSAFVAAHRPYARLYLELERHEILDLYDGIRRTYEQCRTRLGASRSDPLVIKALEERVAYLEPLIDKMKQEARRELDALGTPVSIMPVGVDEARKRARVLRTAAGQRLSAPVSALSRWKARRRNPQ